MNLAVVRAALGAGRSLIRGASTGSMTRPHRCRISNERNAK
jgi:hypothetical protein